MYGGYMPEGGKKCDFRVVIKGSVQMRYWGDEDA